MQVYNKSKLIMEIATNKKCPRCKGFGLVTKDIDNCYLCNGHGRLWISENGWTRPFYSFMNDSKLY